MGSLVASIRDVNAVGIIMVTLGSMGWGIYTILIRPVSAQYGPVPVACLTLGISAFPVLLFATPELPHVMASLTTAQILTILSVVVFCTIGGTVAWNFALGYLDANRAGMFLYGQPIVAAVAGFALLHEQPSLYLVAGGILIIVGVVISQFGPALFPKLSELEPDTGHHLDPHYYP
jgi:drug/metabolite transporter (DMT)-like permease